MSTNTAGRKKPAKKPLKKGGKSKSRVEGGVVLQKEEEAQKAAAAKKSKGKSGKSAAKAAQKAGKGKAAKQKGKKKKAPKKPTYTAKTADKHELYQISVQSPEADVDFLVKCYRGLRGKKALHMREDFCGTALLAAEWISRSKDMTAEGFDIDEDVISWGMEHNYAPLGDDAQRCTLHLRDVREPSHTKPDIRCAQNFSYSLLKTRAEMLDYFSGVLQDLADDGIFVMDMHGGPESMEEMEEERELEEGFTYVWDQDVFWPATGEYKCYIHFRFEDGTEMKRAFSYDWRLWTMPEIIDILKEVGFAEVHTYWEGTDEDGESGDGNFRKKRRGENCLSWIAYIVGVK